MEASNIKAIKLYEYALKQIDLKDKEITELRKRLKVADEALEKCVNYNNSWELKAAEENAKNALAVIRGKEGTKDDK